MSIIYLTSVSGAPGVSTLATALTVNWPRPSLLLEADTSKTTQLIPGYLRAEYEHSRGLTKAALANRRGDLNAGTLFAQTISLGEGRYAIPGFEDVGGAYGSTPAFWSNMTTALDRLPHEIGVRELDIIVDAGRHRPSDARATLISQADAVLVLSGNTLPDSNALYNTIPPLLQMLENAGHQEYLNLVLTQHASVKGFGPSVYGPKELHALLGINTIETFPWDSVAAAHFAYGAHAPSKKSSYMKKLDALIAALETTLSSRRYVPQEAN